MKTIITTVLLCLISLLSNANEKFDKGVEAFKSGDYETAYSFWSDIKGESAALNYNLGNYWFIKGELGKSILYYERALQMDPSDEEIIHNLEIAKRERIDEFEILPTTITKRFLIGVLGLTSSNILAGLGMLSFFMSAVFWVFYLIGRQPKRKFFFAFVTAGLIGFLFTTLSYSKYKFIDSVEHAVILAPNVYVKNGPAETESDVFILHDGTKVEIKTRDNNWVKIKLPDGKIGWIEETNCASI